jgi:hypothetical protein
MVIWDGGLKPVMTIILPLTLTWPGPGLGFHPEIHPDILTLTLTLP